jgi:hypothetical protein
MFLRVSLIKTLAPVFVVLILHICSMSIAQVPPKDVPTYDWGVIYYMSYDNNLESLGKPIIEMIRAGVTSNRTVAAVQADFSDRGGMHRYVIKDNKVVESRVASDDSASEEQAANYIEWFRNTFLCKRYIIIFLDHGGKHDEMCNDGNPDTKNKNWMSGRVLGEKLRNMSKQCELLFFQQCGRGSIENLYSFRETAQFIMSSPISVGAPNTYYTALHKWLAENPAATGDKIATKISQEDRDYTIYTCLRAEKLKELPQRLDTVLTPIIARAKIIMPDTIRVIYSDGGEAVVDAKTFLTEFSTANGVAASETAEFFQWAQNELFTLVQFNGDKEKLANTYCGLSMLIPMKPGEATFYSNLGLYQNSKLHSLWNKIIDQQANK